MRLFVGFQPTGCEESKKKNSPHILYTVLISVLVFRQNAARILNVIISKFGIQRTCTRTTYLPIGGKSKVT